MRIFDEGGANTGSFIYAALQVEEAVLSPTTGVAGAPSTSQHEKEACARAQMVKLGGMEARRRGPKSIRKPFDCCKVRRPRIGTSSSLPTD